MIVEPCGDYCSETAGSRVKGSPELKFARVVTFTIFVRNFSRRLVRGYMTYISGFHVILIHGPIRRTVPGWSWMVT